MSLPCGQTLVVLALHLSVAIGPTIRHAAADTPPRCFVGAEAVGPDVRVTGSVWERPCPGESDDIIRVSSTGETVRLSEHLAGGPACTRWPACDCGEVIDRCVPPGRYRYEADVWYECFGSDWVVVAEECDHDASADDVAVVASGGGCACNGAGHGLPAVECAILVVLASLGGIALRRAR